MVLSAVVVAMSIGTIPVPILRHSARIFLHDLFKEDWVSGLIGTANHSRSAWFSDTCL